jgi:hypothetical protein
MSLITRIASTRKDLEGRRRNNEPVTPADANVFNALLAQVQEKAPDDPVVAALGPVQPNDGVTYGDVLSWYTQMFEALPRARSIGLA